MSPRKLKFLFHPLEGTGHLNSCIGMAQALADLGHECVFAINESLTSAVEQYGFRAAVLEQKPAAVVEAEKDAPEEVKDYAYSDNPAKDMGASIDAMGIFTHKTSYEKLAAYKTNDEEANFMEKVVQLLIVFNPQFEAIMAAEKFDCFVLDHFFFPPAFGKKDIPVIQIISAAPLSLYNSPKLPPGGSGYPLNDPSEWEVYRQLNDEANEHYSQFQTRLNDHFGFKNDNHYSKAGFFTVSPFLNLYQYPKELDYLDVISVPKNCLSMDAFCRHETTKLELPEEFQNAHANNQKLIYLSMGSMGSFDINLMQRMSKILSQMPGIKTIVSKGPRGDEYELPENCWGANSLPQPAIVEIVDLVITHGGNNSVCETFAQGKPMIVLPLFGDQYDNAQRLQETGFGRRIEPYNFTDNELIDAVNQLLNHEELKTKLQAAKQRIEKENLKQKVAKLVEEKVLNNL